MSDNLVIVESPAKAKTIEKFLGKDFTVMSSYGHIRDLAKKNLGIEIDNNYAPQYIIPEDKKKVVKDLKAAAKKSKMVWLASDEDREGEAIAWHLYEVLGLTKSKTKRIVFHEITKNAIKNAVENPRMIDENLVNAQQARRILDRLVGFELSPVLWKKVKPGLSAGRVQSVAVRLLVEREREIMNFKSKSSFKITANFFTDKNQEIKAELAKKIDEENDTVKFLEDCKHAEFLVESITKKPGKKSPAPPFTTSTLQQEASRKLGFSVSQTMAVAQRLYEAGKITYMRTDSVNLSKAAIAAAKEMVLDHFGEKYHKARNFTTKSKGAQEAHEAIRPTYLNRETTSGSENEKKLYNLIWKRTVASQMSEAKLEKTNIQLGISTRVEKFIASGELLKFDGFLKLYIESTDEEKENSVSGLLPRVNEGEKLSAKEIQATQRFTHHPPRYTEASLVKKLEELGIGRPSTYAPTISTIQNRGYVIKEERPGVERQYLHFTMQSGDIKREKKTEITGAEKGKLFPNDIGMVVNDFLNRHFKEILSYNFTAEVEEEFDEIAEGNKEWMNMIDRFYKPFHEKVEETVEKSERSVGERVLGVDPKSGKEVRVKIGPYGPMAQIGSKDDEEKPRFASLRKGQHLETISFEEALNLFRLPRKIGEYEGKEIIIGIGRFGPYARHNNKFYSLKKGVDDPYTIKKERAIELIEEKREKDRKKLIKDFGDDFKLLNGRWGPYISYQKKNYKIPKDTDTSNLSKEGALKIIEEAEKSPKKKKTGRKRK